MRKKNSGFTLSELLAVIVILTLIITIASTSVASIMNKGRTKLAREIRDNLKEAALSYSLEKFYLKKCATTFNPENIRSTDNGCYVTVTVDELLKEGLFEDSHGFCDKSDKAIVYHYSYKNEKNETLSEYRAYVSDSVCNN